MEKMEEEGRVPIASYIRADMKIPCHSRGSIPESVVLTG